MNQLTIKVNKNQIPLWIPKILHWAASFEVFNYFNPNGYTYPEGTFKHALFVGSKASILPLNKTFEALKNFSSIQEFTIGYLTYDVKNELENLKSDNPDFMQFASSHFYHPQYCIFFGEDEILIQSTSEIANLEQVWQDEIENQTLDHPFVFKPVISKETYLQKVRSLQHHILEGDIYEVNFCMEFQAENQEQDPILVYQSLNSISPTPFSVLQKNGTEWLMCASPERFIKKQGNKLISQPIKGTIRRGKDGLLDEELKSLLLNSEKERAENMMIVDLVRNDLAKSAIPGSVHVSEMFGIYTFPQVHQMLSTVKAELSPEIHPIDAIKHAFPMGSMTGAPKIRSMELIENHEESKRGLFSGTVGYFSPEGDFDFNVVIRSIFYHSTSKKISFQVGSAITYDSDPEAEYDECLLKAKAILQSLNATINLD